MQNVVKQNGMYCLKHSFQQQNKQIWLLILKCALVMYRDIMLNCVLQINLLDS